MNTNNVINNILGVRPKTDIKSKNKRACNVCGKIHKNMPFTDCYSEEKDGEQPDDLQDFYKRKFGE